jgi:hypothetical protein
LRWLLWFAARLLTLGADCSVGASSDIVSGTRGGRVRPADRYIRYKPQQLRAREQNACTVRSGDLDRPSTDFELGHMEK